MQTPELQFTATRLRAFGHVVWFCVMFLFATSSAATWIIPDEAASDTHHQKHDHSADVQLIQRTHTSDNFCIVCPVHEQCSFACAVGCSATLALLFPAREKALRSSNLVPIAYYQPPQYSEKPVGPPVFPD